MKTLFESIIAVVVIALTSPLSHGAERPSSVFILADSGEVTKVSLATGETVATRDLQAYYARHVYADPYEGAWACLEGARGGGPPLLFLDPVTLDPVYEWYPPVGKRPSRQEEAGQDIHYMGDVLVHPDGSKIYYESRRNWVQTFVLAPRQQKTLKSLGSYGLISNSLFRRGETWFCLVTAGEREEYQRRLVNITTDTIGPPISWPEGYRSGALSIGSGPAGKGFLAIALRDLDKRVDLLQVDDEKGEHGILMDDLRRLLPNLGRFSTLTADGRYVVCPSQPAIIDILNLTTKEVKRVPLDEHATRPGWNFRPGTAPYLFDGWDKMIYPLCENYDYSGTLSNPPWPKARGKQVNLLIIDIPTATVERVIEVHNCGGFRDLAIMGSSE